MAALIQDLKRRGLLDETIVLWGGEFVGLRNRNAAPGRDHHNTGFSMWVAGGGFKGGIAYGATDDIGLKATVDAMHFRDLHVTLPTRWACSRISSAICTRAGANASPKCTGASSKRFWRSRQQALQVQVPGIHR